MLKLAVARVVELVVTVFPIFVQVLPLFTDAHNSQVLEASVPNTPWLILTCEAPLPKLKFMVSEPVFCMRADLLPTFLSVLRVPMSALLNLHEPVLKVTFPMV
jgi:hypothetical protein